jgi:hypothetical protein
MRRVFVFIASACAFGTVLTHDVHGYVTYGVEWAETSVPYYVNPANVEGLSSSGIVADFQSAAAVWPTQAGVNVQLSYAGPTTSSVLALDYKNNIFFRDDSVSYYIAETYAYYDGSNHLVDFDTVWHEASYRFFLDPNGTGTGCSGNGQYLGNIAVHEFGHALGMGHSTVTGAVMYATVPYCNHTQWTLTADDIAGIRSLYPLASAPPAAPSSLTAAGNSSSPTSSLKLAWVNQTTSDQGIRVERSSNGVTFAQIAQIGASSTAYMDSGLASGSKYYYRVDAFNASGTSGYSNVASAQTQAVTTAPSAPSSPNPVNGATGVGTNVTLSWSCSGAQAYDVYLGSTVYASNVTSPTVSMSGLAYSTRYSWHVVAKNSAGSTTSPTWSFTTKANTTTRKKH